MWIRGRRAGLPLYCWRAKIFDEASRGRSISHVCPAESADARGEVALLSHQHRARS